MKILKTRSLITKTILGEATTPPKNISFDWTKKEAGQVPFKHTSITDPHIKEILQIVANKTNIPIDQLESSVLLKVKEFEELKNYSYFLYDTMLKNAVENAAFDLIEHVAESDEFADRRVMFNSVYWDRLKKSIENKSNLFPISSYGKFNYKSRLDAILLPSTNKADKKYEPCETAYVNEDGVFVFNKKFLQRLLDFAVVENVKPKDSKYGTVEEARKNSNKIPYPYIYIEWVILHEIFHYIFDDFGNAKRSPQYDFKTHNITTDLRSNYRLVSSGYGQLPIGLFSDHINSDRQATYREMLEKVHRELQKIPPKLRNKIKVTDDHSEQEKEDNDIEKSPPIVIPYKASVGDVVRLPDKSYGQVTKVDNDGSFDVKPLTKDEVANILNYPKGSIVRENARKIFEGRFKPDQVTWMKPYNPPSDNKQPPQPPQPPQPVMKGEDPEVPTPPRSGSGEKGKEKEQEQDKETDEDQDAVDKAAEKKWKDIEHPTDKPGKTSEPAKVDPTKKTPGSRGSSISDFNKIDVTNLTPSLDWSTILKNLIQGTVSRGSPSYRKMNPRSIGFAPLAKEKGVMPVKPGTIRQKIPMTKIALVLDTSGSMAGIYPLVLKEAQSLVSNLSKDAVIAVCMFAGNSRWAKADLTRDEWWPIDSIQNLDDDPENPRSGIDGLLSLQATGATQFAGKLQRDLSTLLDDGWNIVIFTDDGITFDSENWQAFINLYDKHADKICYIVDNLRTWQESIKKKIERPSDNGIIPDKTWTAIHEEKQ